MKKVGGSSKRSRAILRLTVGCMVVALLMVVLPGGVAERGTGAETSGIYHGYRMLDGAEPDGPIYGGYLPLVEIETGTSEVPVMLDLPLHFPVYGCPNDSVVLWVSGLDFIFCEDRFDIDVSSDDEMVYKLEIGLDSRGVPANLLSLVIWDFPLAAIEGVVALSVDGVVEMHVNNGEGTLTWHPQLFDEAISWQPPQSNTVARWEPLGALENNEEAFDQDGELVLPSDSIWVSNPEVGHPGVPGQNVGPFGVDPIPVGTPDIPVGPVCTPVVPVLCVDEFTIPGHDLGTTPGVGPLGPIPIPGVPGMQVSAPVDLRIGHGDIRIYGSTDVPEPGVWEGINITLPVPIIGDVVVRFCEGCPLPLLPDHEIYGTVFVRGTVGDVPIDIEVPFRVGGSSN